MGVPEDYTPNEIKSGMWWRHLVSGGIAGAVSRTLTAPLDRIKVYFQVYGNKQTEIKSCLQVMLKEGGFKSMWRGNGMNVIKIAPESAIKFMCYEQLKALIKSDTSQRELSIMERFVAGSLAGEISQTAIYPLEVLKTKLSLQKSGQYSGIFDAAKKIYSTQGIRAFFRGYIPNLLGIIPYAGIDLAVYESLKNGYLNQHSKDDQKPSLLYPSAVEQSQADVVKFAPTSGKNLNQHSNDDQKPGVLLLLCCGTISSTCGQVCSYPLALVRTRLQVQDITASTYSSQNMKSLFKTIIQKDGFFGLYRGFMVNFFKVAPAVSISYVVYENVRTFLGVKMS